MTRTSEAAWPVLALVLAGSGIVGAQDRAAQSGSAGSSEKGPGCEGGPLAVVAQVLTLAPEQVQALAQLIQERQEQLGPIQQEIAAREQLIEQLIASGGDPAQIGQLMIEIHQLRQAAQAVQAQFLASFRSVLDSQQQERWAQVQMAAHLQPVVPAFAALGLL